MKQWFMILMVLLTSSLRLGGRTRIRECHDKVGVGIRELILKFDL